MKTQEIVKKYPVAIFAGGALVLFAALAFFRSGSVDDLRAELSSRETEAARLADNVHNGQKLSTQLDRLESLTKDIAGRLSSPTDVAGNQQYFYKLEADSGVKLADLHQMPGLVRSKKSKYTQYSTVTYSASVQGDFAHLVTFLRNLESGSKLSVITGADLSLGSTQKTPDDPGPSAILQLNLSIQLLGTP